MQAASQTAPVSLHSSTSVLQSRFLACSSRSRGAAAAAVRVRSLPRIADFIRDECPVKGLDGTFKEQPVRPGTLLEDSCVLQMHEEALLVPGQRQLMYVTEPQLEQVIADAGKAVLACLQNNNSSSSTAGGAAGGTPKLLSPARGSWALAASVGGVQRLPGSSRALIRLLVTDRVAVQALNSPSPGLVLARSAQLRDRWCYFVRTAAVQQYLDSSSSSSADGNASESDSSSTGGAGRDVVNAVQQVQDAASELLQLLQQVYSSVQQVTEAAGGAGSSSLQQQLVQHEAVEELAELLSWCELQQHDSSSSGGGGSVLFGPDGLLPSDRLLLERAWRLSFAPFACKGLAVALGVDVETGKSVSVSSSSSEVLEMMDLGLRLEAAWELGQALRQRLSTRLSLESLQS